jgi:predicted RNA methylase
MVKIPNALLENLFFCSENHSGHLYTMKDLFFVEHILTKPDSNLTEHVLEQIIPNPPFGIQLSQLPVCTKS